MAKCPYCGETLTANEEGVLLCAKCNKRFRRKETQAPTSAGEQASGKPDGAVAAQTASNHGETPKTESRPTQPAHIPAEENSQTAGTDVAAGVTETTGSSAAVTPVAGNTAEQDEIAQLRARIAAMEAKESERERGKRGSVLKKLDNTKFAPVVAFTKKWGLKAILPAVLVLIALITLLTCFCGLRGIYVNVDNPNEFYSFDATGYEYHGSLLGEEYVEKGSWKTSGGQILLTYKDEDFGKLTESYDFSSQNSYKTITITDDFGIAKEFKRVSLLAYSTAQKIKVTFDGNGGSGGDSQKIDIGSKIKEPAEPTRDGYLFMGWYTTPESWKNNDGERVSFDNRVWEKATYYANWKNAATFKLTGDGLVNAVEFTEGDNIETAYMRARGWNSFPEGVTGLIFTDSDGNEINGKFAPAANVSVAVVYDDRIVDGTLQYVNPALKEYTIPAEVSVIASNAFDGCTALEKIYITSRTSSLTVQSGVFDDCEKLASIEGYADTNAMKAVIDASGITRATVVAGTIVSNAFSSCSGLTSVTIGNGVTSIGDDAFYGCSGLTSVYYTGDVAGWCGISGLGNIMSSGRTLYIDGNKLEGAIAIPDGVQSVPSYAFYYQTGITSITIPGSVTNIGGSAFHNCSGLTSVYYTGDVASWCGISGLGNIMSSGRTLYIDGNKLEGAIVIPDGVQSVPSYAFYYQTGITSITIPDSVTSIGSSAFYNCSGLTSVTIGNSVTSIGDYAFEGCSGLTSIIIPDSVTSIGNSAFEGCSRLTSVIIGDGVTSIGSYAFWDCSGLTSVTIGNGVTSIESYAFEWCSSLTSIVIPDSVTSIGYEAFRGCSGLISITIPDSVTSIGNYAFYGCYKLVEVYNKSKLNIVAGSSGYGDVAYYAKNVYTEEGGSKLTTDENGFVFYYDGATGYLVGYTGNENELVLPDGFTAYDGTTVSTYEIYEYAFNDCSGLTSVTIGDSVTSIGDDAFCNCSSLTSVTIGNSVTSIGSYAFYGCYTLVEVYNKSQLKIVAGSSGYGSVAYYAKNVYTEEGGSKLTTDKNGFIFYYDGATGYLVGYTGNESELVLPDGFIAYNGARVNTYEINMYAFRGCSGLTSITIPDSVTSIGDYAFDDCSSLTSITIPDSVTSIGDYAFDGCRGLTSITIPDSVTSIGNFAFCGCSGLTSIVIPDSVTSIGQSAFSGCSGLTSVTIGNSVTSIGSDAFSGCSGLTEINWNAVSVSGFSSRSDVFNNAGTAGDGITVTFGDGVEKIPAYLFYVSSFYMSYRPNIVSVTIGNGVTSLGNYAFYGCRGLTSITIPDSVTSIGSNAFQGCRGLTSITIPDSVTSIGNFAFCNCSGLTSIVIPDSVTSIGSNAFQGCSGLTSVTIGNSVTSIGQSAFSGCSGLKSVTIGNGVEDIGYQAFCNCSGLTSITIGDSVTSIESGAFSGCSGLTSVTFENTSGWQVATSLSSFDSYTSLSSSSLSNTSTAANYLKSTYDDYYWRRV